MTFLDIPHGLCQSEVRGGPRSWAGSLRRRHRKDSYQRGNFLPKNHSSVLPLLQLACTHGNLHYTFGAIDEHPSGLLHTCASDHSEIWGWNLGGILITNKMSRCLGLWFPATSRQSSQRRRRKRRKKNYLRLKPEATILLPGCGRVYRSCLNVTHLFCLPWLL